MEVNPTLWRTEGTPAAYLYDYGIVQADPHLASQEVEAVRFAFAHELVHAVDQCWRRWAVVIPALLLLAATGATQLFRGVDPFVSVGVLLLAGALVVRQRAGSRHTWICATVASGLGLLLVVGQLLVLDARGTAAITLGFGAVSVVVHRAVSRWIEMRADKLAVVQLVNAGYKKADIGAGADALLTYMDSHGRQLVAAAKRAAVPPGLIRLPRVIFLLPKVLGRTHPSNRRRSRQVRRLCR